MTVNEALLLAAEREDRVNHPKHYTSHPSGIECIQITEHMGFNLGNALKYIWRADLKGSDLEDLQKARWYIERELAKRTAGSELKLGIPGQIVKCDKNGRPL